ncbi:MAG: hypothetical protein IJ567_06530 [Lachnospiraceae bacterium]|nr:hypothetical protein [Lachnospiraceae bacterium]
MSFLSNLLSREARRAITSVVDQTVTDAVRKGLNQFGQGSSSPANTPSTTTATQSKTAAQPNQAATVRKQTAVGADPQTIDNRIQSVLTELNRDRIDPATILTLRSSVPASELQANPEARDYSYGVYQNGQPKCMIMVLTNRNDYQRRAVRLSHEAAENAGVSCINLMTHLPNETSYISQKIQESL